MTISTGRFSADSRRNEARSVGSVVQQAEAALRSSSHSGLRHVRTRFNNGHVTLTGCVTSFYLKQLAQTIVGRLPQVASVDNQLTVQSPADPAT